MYDPVIQANVGFAAMNKNESGTPTLIPNVIMDKTTSMTGAQAIRAVYARDVKGADGQHIELSMLYAGLQFVWPDIKADIYWQDESRVTPKNSFHDMPTPENLGFVIAEEA